MISLSTLKWGASWSNSILSPDISSSATHAVLPSLHQADSYLHLPFSPLDRLPHKECRISSLESFANLLNKDHLISEQVRDSRCMLAGFLWLLRTPSQGSRTLSDLRSFLNQCRSWTDSPKVRRLVSWVWTVCSLWCQSTSSPSTTRFTF